jgi:hypothetical protein
VIATLAAINVLKEERRRRFVAAGGIEPRRDAYKGIVHDDEKTNAVVAIRYGKKKCIATEMLAQDSTDSLPKDTRPLPMKIRRQRSFYVGIGHHTQPCQVREK